MIAIVDTLGAPVIDAHGNSASNTSFKDVPTVGSASTVEVNCQTVSYFSVVNKAGTLTVPTLEIRPRSLRTISTIIRFSARSFSEDSSRARSPSSAASMRPRRRVPFIGLETIRPWRHSKNNSGEAEATTKRPVSTRAPYPQAWALTRSR